MKTILRTIALGTVLATAPTMVLADGHAIKYRKAVMKAIGGHMGAISGILKGAGDAADLKAHTDAMAAMAHVSRTIYPEGSDFGDTKALDAIWDKPAEFKTAVDNFVMAADALKATNGDPAKVGAALGALGKSCKGCHEGFRESKK